MNRIILASLFCLGGLADGISARPFNSTLTLKVFERGSADVQDRFLGFTPSRRGHRVNVPEEKLWYVRPKGNLSAVKLRALVQLAKRERIPGLDLSDHWELTNESLAHLKPLDQLYFLDISRTKITDGGLTSLVSCKQLSAILLPDTITDQGIDELRKLKNLREINLDRARITDRSLEMLAQLPKLAKLDLSATRMTDEGMVHLTKITRLSRVVLSGTITDKSAEHLAALKNLREIDISQTQIGEKGLAALATLPKLSTIYLNPQTNDDGLKALSASTSLRAVDLSRTRITDRGVKHLVKIKTLEELAFTQTAIGNDCLTHLAGLPELKMLELSETQVTSAGLGPLANNKKLEAISLSWQKLTRADLQGMAKLKQLKMIVLNGVPLPDETMAQLKGLGSPSPWDDIAGLERARFQETRKMDSRALAAPVNVSMAEQASPQIKTASRLTSAAPSPNTFGMGSTLSEGKSSFKGLGSQPQGIPPKGFVPRVTKEKELPLALTKPDVIASRPVKGSAPAPAPIALKDASRPGKSLSVGESIPQMPEPVAQVPVKSQAKVPKGQDEENLLQTISLQSNPARAGGFGGLSGMRNIRHTENVAAINTVAVGDTRSEIQQQEDKPENFIGEISVGAERSR